MSTSQSRSMTIHYAQGKVFIGGALYEELSNAIEQAGFPDPFDQRVFSQSSVEIGTVIDYDHLNEYLPIFRYILARKSGLERRAAMRAVTMLDQILADRIDNLEDIEDDEDTAALHRELDQISRITAHLPPMYSSAIVDTAQDLLDFEQEREADINDIAGWIKRETFVVIVHERGNTPPTLEPAGRVFVRWLGSAVIIFGSVFAVPLGLLDHLSMHGPVEIVFLGGTWAFSLYMSWDGVRGAWGARRHRSKRVQPPE